MIAEKIGIKKESFERRSNDSLFVAKGVTKPPVQLGVGKKA